MATRTGRSDRAAAETAPAPVVLGRYRLQSRLGTGAFGTVWRARDERLERDVAIKILARERIVDGRFEREARVAARLSHPAIVTLYEASVDDEGAYLVSELVAGATLGRLLAAGRLSDQDILRIGVALGDALTHAHAHGVIHRDVKPSNVLVPDAPPTPAQVAKLTDFGVARLAGAGALTEDGDVIGTLDYMAPEQAAGQSVGAEADLYSLALVLYEALTGVPPRAGVRPAPLRRQRRDLPNELGRGIDAALHPDPGRRGTVAELRAVLAAWVDEVGDAPGIVEAPTSVLTFWRRGREGEAAAAWQDGPAQTAATAWQDGPAQTAATAWHDQPEGAPATAWPGRPADETPAEADTSWWQGAPWLARAGAAVAGGAAAAWLSERILTSPPVSPATAGLVAGAAVLVSPRLAWLALTATLCGTAAVQGHGPAALVAAIGLLMPVVLLPARPSLWPLAAGAPALGLLPVAGLAGAWPALAGRAASPYRRAVLAAAGWCWLVAASRLDGRALYLPGDWVGNGTALVRIVTSGALVPAAVWAVAAAVLPWLVRAGSPWRGRTHGPSPVRTRSPGLSGTRSPWLPAATAAAWAALTLLAIRPLTTAVVGASASVPMPPGAVGGAILAGVLAFAGAALGRERGVSRAGSTAARVT